jgi:tetratricopeptide (TPR) repeat protein
MRTHIIRGVLSLVAAVVLAATAFAQGGVLRGTVVDAQDKPLQNATLTFESEDGSARRVQTRTNNRGEFVQVGLASGNWNVTAVSGQLKQSLRVAVTQSENKPIAFKLTPTSAADDAARAAAAKEFTAAAQEAVAAMQASNYDLAIEKFQALTLKLNTCSDCYYNLGLAYTRKQDYAKAEENFKKVIEIKPDYAEAYSGLANVYNAQRKFDLAVEMSTKAASLATANPAGMGAEAMYNQGVTLWNAQKYADAKTQFEAAVKSDPKLALAWYQLAMANLNLGQIPEAKAAFEGYLKADPNGAKAAEVQAMLKQLP